MNIRVGLVTGWTDKCGITEYGHHMTQFVPGEDITLRPVPVPFEQCLPFAHEFDIMVMNESGFSMQGFTGAAIVELKNKGIKTALIQHASNPKNNKNVLSLQFDRVFIHERNTEDGFTFIPQGCPVYNKPAERLRWDVGVCGFPMPHKNLPRLAEATKALGLSLMALTPESNHANAQDVVKNVTRINPRSACFTNWLSDTLMLDYLSACAMLVFPYTNHTPGPSAAALWGVAAHRPVIVSRSAQFEHLFDREDQFYFIDSADPSAQEIQDVLVQAHIEITNGHARSAEPTYEEHRWDNVGKLYRQAFREMMA